MKNRRSHSKISTYPVELVDAINQEIVKGRTYRQIADWLNEKGKEISHVAVANYGKNFLSKLEQLKAVKEQAKAIVAETGDGPATEMAEAANQLAIQMIMETLMEVEKGKLEKEKLTDVLKALAQLEKSSVAREGLKLQYQKKFDSVFKKVREELWQELGQNPEFYEQVLNYVNRIEQRMSENLE